MRTFIKGDATTRTGVPARAVDLLARGWVEITDETPPGHEDFDVHSWTPPTTSTVTVARGETVVTPETARSYRDQAPPRSPADDRDDTPDWPTGASPMASPNSRATSRRTTAPKAKVSLDLDKLEREGDQPDPFTFRHGGQTFTLAGPGDIDYRDLVELGENPMGQALMIRRLLGDQYTALAEAGPLPQWKVGPLLDKWMEHYGMPGPGEAGASLS